MIDHVNFDLFLDVGALSLDWFLKIGMVAEWWSGGQLLNILGYRKHVLVITYCAVLNLTYYI